jgi:hypothetical protein
MSVSCCGPGEGSSAVQTLQDPLCPAGGKMSWSIDVEWRSKAVSLEEEGSSLG